MDRKSRGRIGCSLYPEPSLLCESGLMLETIHEECNFNLHWHYLKRDREPQASKLSHWVSKVITDRIVDAPTIAFSPTQSKQKYEALHSKLRQYEKVVSK